MNARIRAIDTDLDQLLEQLDGIEAIKAINKYAAALRQTKDVVRHLHRDAKFSTVVFKQLIHEWNILRERVDKIDTLRERHREMQLQLQRLGAQLEQQVQKRRKCDELLTRVSALEHALAFVAAKNRQARLSHAA